MDNVPLSLHAPACVQAADKVRGSITSARERFGIVPTTCQGRRTRFLVLECPAKVVKCAPAWFWESSVTLDPRDRMMETRTHVNISSERMHGSVRTHTSSKPNIVIPDARIMHAPPGLSPRVRECERGVYFPKPHTFCSRGSAIHAAFPAAEERNLPILPAALIAPSCAGVHIAPRGGHSYR
ncbi:hypothetical protein C8R44DRAFT_736841 [Mycena epipterygia]|nr:hypothetical protein C8R44DRAFT_736841 [Mycena epipterygia]